MTDETQDLMATFGRLLQSRYFMTAMALNNRTKRNSDENLGRGRLRLLSLLGKTDGITNAEIAEKLDIRPSSVSLQVKALVDAGMAERRASETDGRVSLIFITTLGEETLAGLHNGNDSLSERAFNVLTGAEQEQLQSLLRRVAANVEDIQVTPEEMREAFGAFGDQFKGMHDMHHMGRDMHRQMHQMRNDGHGDFPFAGWFNRNNKTTKGEDEDI